MTRLPPFLSPDAQPAPRLIPWWAFRARRRALRAYRERVAAIRQAEDALAALRALDALCVVSDWLALSDLPAAQIEALANDLGRLAHERARDAD